MPTPPDRPSAVFSRINDSIRTLFRFSLLATARLNQNMQIDHGGGGTANAPPCPPPPPNYELSHHSPRNSTRTSRIGTPVQIQQNNRMGMDPEMRRMMEEEARKIDARPHALTGRKCSSTSNSAAYGSDARTNQIHTHLCVSPPGLEFWQGSIWPEK